MFAQDLLVIMRTILAASVAVMDASLRWPAQGDRHVQGADRQVFLHTVADGPTDHPTGMEVQNDRQIDPAFARPDIGDVPGPLLVGLARREVLARRRFGAMLNLWSLSVRRRKNDPPDHFLTLLHLEFMGSDHGNGVLPHQTAHPAVPNTHPQLVQLFGHPRPAIAAQTGSMLIADMCQQHHVTPLSM